MPALIFQGCFPMLPFGLTRTPAAPDYSKSRYWSALPQKRDSGDAIIPGVLKNGEAHARVDVFFVHPTTYPKNTLWNADLKDTAVNRRTDRLASRYQATVFNGDCRVYVPRYRMAAFFAYLWRHRDGRKAFDLAYSDVKAAFDYYLLHYNKGRPIIIAGHSQGSDHAVRLLQEYFDGDTTELQKQLVAAYVPGSLIYKSTFKNLPLCDSASECGCYVTWNSVPWFQLTFYGRPIRPVECVNPLTWTTSKEHAPDSLNKGGMPFGFTHIDKGLADAKISPIGLLWVHRPKNKSKKQYPQINGPSYHILDYNLFYMNIRENIHQRIDCYMGGKRRRALRK